jgi:hypothetical protein
VNRPEAIHDVPLKGMNIMNENKITGTPAGNENRAVTDLSRAEILARYDADKAAAQARPCGIVGCDGSLHEANPADDMHRFSQTVFDGGEVEIEGYFSAGKYTGSVLLNGISDDMSPTELRAKADIYDELPTLLRQYADTLESRRMQKVVELCDGRSTVGDVYRLSVNAGIDAGAALTTVLEKVSQE